MAPISMTSLKLGTKGYSRPIIPYRDDDNSDAVNLLCPRYAESDRTSAPPSPASIESFDAFDDTPWRKSYISLGDYNSRDSQQLKLKRTRTRTRIIAILFLLALLVGGCTMGAIIAVQHAKASL